MAVTQFRPAGRPFKAGQSGNPGGRPKVIAPIRDLARDHSGDAITTLLSIMRDEAQPGACRVAAAREILDRGFGKPTQMIAGDPTGTPIRSKIEIVIVDPKHGPAPRSDAKRG